MSRSTEPNEPTNRSVSELLTRREVLAATGAVGLTGLAGCAGERGGPDNENKDTFSMAHSEAFNPNNANFLDKQLRETDPKGYVNSWNYAFFASTRLGSHFGQEIPYYAAKEVKRTDKGCAREVTLVDGLKWWDGTPVTGEGLKMRQDILNFMDYGPNPGDKPNMRYEIVDKKKRIYRRVFKTARNEYETFHRLFDSHNYHPKWYKKVWEKMSDATTQKEIDAIVSEVGSKRISMKNLKEDGLGCGPYKPTKWTGHSMTWEKVKGHPLDLNNIDTWTWQMVSDKNSRITGYKQGNFDAVGFGDTGDVPFDSIPDLNAVDEFTFNSSISLRFQMDNPHSGDRAFRHAVGYLLDFKHLTKTLNDNGFPAKVVQDTSGVARKVANHWYGKEWLNKLIDHGQTANTKKAEQTLKDAGYSKQGGSWVGPDGNEVKLKFIVPSGAGKVLTTAEYVKGALENFGIKLDFRMLPGPKLKKARENANFDMMLWWPFAGPANGQPVDAYIAKFGTLDRFDKVRKPDYTKPTPESGCGGEVTFEKVPYTKEKGPWLKVPVHDEFPVEVGRNDLNGETQQLMPLKWKYEAAQASEDRIRELGKKLAWYTNFSMARINLWDEVTTIAGNTKDYTWKDSVKAPQNGITTVHRAVYQILGGRVQRKK